MCANSNPQYPKNGKNKLELTMYALLPGPNGPAPLSQNTWAVVVITNGIKRPSGVKGDLLMARLALNTFR